MQLQIMDFLYNFVIKLSRNVEPKIFNYWRTVFLDNFNKVKIKLKLDFLARKLALIEMHLL